MPSVLILGKIHDIKDMLNDAENIASLCYKSKGL
jgi:hypothetical protein